jgi:hypothetical protein
VRKIKFDNEKLALYGVGAAFLVYGLDKLLDFLNPTNPNVITAKFIFAFSILLLGIFILGVVILK